jgi:hypothetical protein
MIEVKISHKKTTMWNLTRKQRAIILKDGKPVKKYYVKNRTKIDQEVKRLENG